MVYSPRSFRLGSGCVVCVGDVMPTSVYSEASGGQCSTQELDTGFNAGLCNLDISLQM